jgi:vancomycin resistance protein YoaR
MTDITAPGTLAMPRFRGLWPFVAAFLAGLLAVTTISVGGLYAFERTYDGRVLPSVKVGTVDLSGLTEAEARSTLAAAYKGYAEGAIVLESSSGTVRVPFAEVGRRADVDAMVADAMAVGRSGDGPGRWVDDVRVALNGVVLAPRVTYDHDALVGAVEGVAGSVDVAPQDASIARGEAGFEVTAGSAGRQADPGPAIAELAPALGAIDADDEITATIEVASLEPRITTAAAESAVASVARIAEPVTIKLGDDSWTIPTETILPWISFSVTADGRYEPVVETSELPAALKNVADAVKRNPKNASFLVGKDGAVVGVTAGANGRALNMAGTVALVADLLRTRAAGVESAPVEPALRETEPLLTTAQAEASAPLMKKISTWTTYFPISEKNGYGANIWIPALDIDGHVVAPGELFDFWNAVGPISRERGYTDGGAIINGRTEPQGALAGGICSCSTTLFNAALRAGFEMGARKNHYYYIDRYPLGLDATVFKSGSGSVQSMTWRNDTEHPVLIRGYKIRDGSKGYVRFDLYSVPNGRTVNLSKPIVKNVTKATDTTEETSTLPAGKRERIEYPVDGKDVWVTRTVRDASGKVIHQETYYSHYARITGVTLVGTGGSTSSAPKPAATQAPKPAPTQAPTPKPTPKPSPTAAPTPAPTPTPGGR